jgi:hypothetical protein
MYPKELLAWLVLLIQPSDVVSPTYELMASRPESQRGDVMALPTYSDGSTGTADSLAVSSPTSSASAAFARSLFLFLGELLFSGCTLPETTDRPVS